MGHKSCQLPDSYFSVDKPSPPKRVWILGSGFSQSLGGPLLDELLSQTAQLRLATYDDVLPPGQRDPIINLYHYGCAFRHGRDGFPFTRGAGLHAWNDAEEFLERLDLGCRDEHVASQLHDIWKGMEHLLLTLDKDVWGEFDSNRLQTEVQRWRSNARRVVAASCSTFIEGINTESTSKLERWSPYASWYSQLGANDTVVTFNYDRVVELLGRRLTAVEPGDKESSRSDYPSSMGLLLKLHGSVNWEHKTENEIIAHKNWSRTLLSEGKTPAIGLPGNDKPDLVGRQLRNLWGLAHTALYEADEVYFVGYRFPQSDALARSKLLEPLSCRQDRLTAHVALGPGNEKGHSERLTQLLLWTLGNSVCVDGKKPPPQGHEGTIVRRHALYAEDFLGCWSTSASNS